MKTERCLREELKAVGIQIKLVDEASLILLWLEDDQEAVYCFQSRGDEHGLSFRTQDHGMIRSLKDIFAVRWQGSATRANASHRR